MSHASNILSNSPDAQAPDVFFNNYTAFDLKS
jgi:hypothetical protein